VSTCADNQDRPNLHNANSEVADAVN